MQNNDTELDPVEQFKEDYPDEYRRKIDTVKEHSGTILVQLEKGKTICPNITEPLLEAGWVIRSHAEPGRHHKFWFCRLETQDRVVTRTVRETETVTTMKEV